MINKIITIACVAVLFACNNNKQQTSEAADAVKHEHHTTTPPPAAEKKFAGITFANDKDYSCGMPLRAGVEDTVTYKGKLYGFCAKECKEDFLKDPEGHLTAK